MTSRVRVADVAVLAVALLLVVGDVAVGVLTARSGLAEHADDRLGAGFERVSDGGLRAEARRFPVGVAQGASAARVRVAGVALLDAAPDGVGALQEARQAGALREAVGQHGALRVGPARAGVAGMVGQRARPLWRLALELGQAEAVRHASDHTAPGVGSARVRRAFVTLGYCNSNTDK